MKKASLALGIIGGVLAAIVAVIFIVYGIFVTAVGNVASSTDDDAGILKGIAKGVAKATTEVIGTVCFVIGLISAAGAALGFVGAAKVKKNGTVAGILFIIAVIPGIIASILFIIAAVFAFIPDKKAEALAA
jgi:hypothetical protein